MPDRKCAACDQPVTDSDEVCRDCVKRTRRRLAKQPELAHELEVAMTRQARMAEQSDGGRSAETPVPFVPAAAAVIHAQRSTLVAWCRLVSEEGIGQPATGDRIGELAVCISLALPVLRKHEAAGELVREIQQVTERAVRVVDLPPNRLQFVAGPCPESFDGDPCSGFVEITVPRDESEPPMARCGACRTEWRSEHWLRMGHRIAQRVEREQRQRELAQSFRRSA
jgi:hypothetical protein